MEKKLRLYLAGPMTGHPQFNYLEFQRQAKIWRDRGYEIESPAESFNGETGLPREIYINNGLNLIEKSDGVLCMKGWENSPGARLEVQYARETGKPCYDAEMIIPTWFPLDPGSEEALVPLPYGGLRIEDEARAIVSSDRNSQYGEPESNFDRIAKVWSGILNTEVAPEHVTLCLAGLKLVREATNPKRDNRVDTIGYMICDERVINAKQS
jgi:hypothetical protein